VLQVSNYNSLFILSGNDERCVLIYIPDGSKKEPPTTFMSITGQAYFTVLSNEEKPVNKKATTTTVPVATKSVKSVADIFNEIKSVGDEIRDLKSKKASKVYYILSIINVLDIVNDVVVY